MNLTKAVRPGAFSVLMFLAMNNTSAQSCNVTGIWEWSNGLTVTIHADGNVTSSDPNKYGTWTCYNGIVNMEWSHGWFNEYKVTQNGSRMDGEAARTKGAYNGSWIVWGNKTAGTTAASGVAAVNCHNLYGLGVNVGIVELGCHEAMDVSFLIGFLDHAINHAKASGCIASAPLESLRTRMRGASSSGQFYDEVLRIRKSLATEAGTYCGCW